MRNFIKMLKNASNNIMDYEKRRIILVKNFQVQRWITVKRVLFPIVLTNVLGVSLYLYYVNEVYSLKLSLTRKISKITGKITQLYLPLSIRKSIFLGFSKMYGVNLEEIKEDLDSFNTFNEFFTREVKTRAINAEKNNEIISPADSKVISITEITENETLLIKGQKYKLGHFLTGIRDYEIKGDILDSMKKKSTKNKLYQMIFYLNPGDYHRFHCPTNFFIKKRLHMVGYLFPVKESYVETHKEVFETNERIAVFGESPEHGFMSLVFVGALNVGTISLTFDKDLTTNKVLSVFFPKYSYKDYTQKFDMAEIITPTDLDDFLPEEIINYNITSKLSIDFPVTHEGLLARKGCELGRFNMGSTVVMLFEAGENFEFTVKAGDKVKYGDVVGIYKNICNI